MISDLNKVAAIKILKWPITISKLKEFLKVVDFFRKYIQGFGQIAKLLNNMTLSKFGNFWTLKMDEIWKKLKKRLIKASILKHSNFTKLFINVSKRGIGTILA